jgi:NitT/TauT family transport system substrate-binding protein
MKRRTLLGLLPAAALAACAPKTPQSSDGRRRLRFATDWHAQAEHGGFYQALATGEYAKRGLDVQIVQGGAGVTVPQLIAAGTVDMGMGSDDFIVMALASEKVPVKAVAAFFQKNPQVLIAHPDPTIKSLADLKGRPILISAAARDSFWPWLKAKYGLSDDQVRSYNNSSAPFLADPRAVQEGYLTNEPYTIEQAAHFKPTVFLLADEGYPSYAAMALAPDKLIAEHPEAVRGFVEASAVGWKSYLDGDPTPANKLILKDNPEMTQDVIDQARVKMKTHGIVDGGDAGTGGIGVMTDARWADFFKMAVDQGLYPKTLDYKRGYTLAFLPGAGGKTR